MREKNHSHHVLLLDLVALVICAKAVRSGGDDLTTESGRARCLYRVRCEPLDWRGDDQQRGCSAMGYGRTRHMVGFYGCFGVLSLEIRLKGVTLSGL